MFSVGVVGCAREKMSHGQYIMKTTQKSLYHFKFSNLVTTTLMTREVASGIKPTHQVYPQSTMFYVNNYPKTVHMHLSSSYGKSLFPPFTKYVLKSSELSSYEQTFARLKTEDSYAFAHWLGEQPR